MSVAERDYYSRGKPEKECRYPDCTRSAEGDEGPWLCALHSAICEADSDGCEGYAAGEELLPPMIQLTHVMGNRWLEEELKDLQKRALDYAERRYLDYEMLHAEDGMDLDDE